MKLFKVRTAEIVYREYEIEAFEWLHAKDKFRYYSKETLKENLKNTIETGESVIKISEMIKESEVKNENQI